MSDEQTADAGPDAPRELSPLPAATFHLAVDGAGVVRGKVRSNAAQPDMVAVDGPTYDAAVIGAMQLVDGALQPYTPPAPPPPPRRATLAALFDPLSAAQRAAITADHLMRLQADAAAMADGTVYVGSSKVKRAADDMGLAPDDWFKLAGA